MTVFIHNGFAIDDSNLTPAQIGQKLPVWLDKFDQAIKYLEAEPAMAQRLQTMRDKGYAIQFFQEQNGFTNTETHRVLWNPDLSLIVTDSPTQSPTYTK